MDACPPNSRRELIQFSFMDKKIVVFRNVEKMVGKTRYYFASQQDSAGIAAAASGRGAESIPASPRLGLPCVPELAVHRGTPHLRVPSLGRPRLKRQRGPCAVWRWVIERSRHVAKRRAYVATGSPGLRFYREN
jgi:hypothetical protein